MEDVDVFAHVRPKPENVYDHDHRKQDHPDGHPTDRQVSHQRVKMLRGFFRQEFYDGKCPTIDRKEQSISPVLSVLVYFEGV
jgi:hypothetical protein